MSWRLSSQVGMRRELFGAPLARAHRTSVIAVDQIDTLIARSSLATKGTVAGSGRPEALIVERIAGGLMALREYTRRTLTVLSCLAASWVLIETVVAGTVRNHHRTS